MPELRWILLGLGVLFCIGLWWRETRRPHQAADSAARAGEPERTEPPIAALEKPRRTATAAPGREPVIFDDGLDLEIEPVPKAESQPAASIDARAAQDRIARELFSNPTADTFERIEPILGDMEIRAAELPEMAPARGPEEKIVTLRLAAPPLERFGGNELVEALLAAGLEHGKFSIFHKSTPEGATLFSVASLVEPGTFDLERVATRRFPGVSLFAVLPGPTEAGAILEDMIATGRQLAERLHGILQDERGAPMTAQRLADLRAAVSEWQRRAVPASSQN